MLNEYDYIECGDCLELMNDIPDKSIDMILCDPPYGTTACKWDSIISFERLWEQYKRIIKPNGAIALFGAMPFTAALVTSNYKGYKHHWIWKKNRGTGFQCAKFRPMMATEDIIVFTANGERVNYYPIKTKLDKPYIGKYSSNTENVGFKKSNKYSYYDSKYPTNVLEYKKPSRPIHPTEKPVDLLEYLIKTYTLEGEIVLDNCMGSGSTCVACVNTNRHYVGFERDEKYFDIACKRLDEAEEVTAC